MQSPCRKRVAPTSRRRKREKKSRERRGRKGAEKATPNKFLVLRPWFCAYLMSRTGGGGGGGGGSWAKIPRSSSSRYLAGEGGASSEGSVVSMGRARAVSGPSPPHIAGRLDRSPSQQSSSRPVHNVTGPIRSCSFPIRSKTLLLFHIYVTAGK